MQLAECKSSDRLSVKVLEIKGQRSQEPQPSLVAAGIQQQVVGMWMESAVSKTKSVEKLNTLLEKRWAQGRCAESKAYSQPRTSVGFNINYSMLHSQ